jgi:PP-loop superfamily ATP-utilizing enzyme
MINASIANIEIGLHPTLDGQITNAATFLVRPGRMVNDESGEHPGEQFIEITLTRQEVREVLQSLDEDWAYHQKFALKLPA